MSRLTDRVGGMVNKAFASVQPLLDAAVTTVSPQLGIQRYATREKLRIMSRFNENGYPYPGSLRKSMKGVRTTPNSPNVDITEKLSGIRGFNRDLFMNSPLVVSILRRHKTETVGSGLQVQPIVDKDYLKLTDEQAQKASLQFQREFDMYAESISCDYEGVLFHAEQQALGYLNMLVSGDFFHMPVFDDPKESGFPYRLTTKLIDADLVRNPEDGRELTHDIQGGVQYDAKGRLEGYYIWDCYEYETSLTGKLGSCVFVPVYDSVGRRQIHHVYDPERIAQRRGVSLIAPVAERAKQASRLTDGVLMAALVSSFFSVFVRDQTGMMMGPAFTPPETATGGGRYGPDEPEVGERNLEDGNDIELGHGNVCFLDDQKDISIAQPNKTDENFADFWESIVKEVCAGANIPMEQAMLSYTTSYTAAKAAANDVYKYRLTARKLMARRFCQPIYEELIGEAVVLGRLSAPGFFDDYGAKKAWCRANWVGSGQGSLDPLREMKAAEIRVDKLKFPYEDEYALLRGGRWDAAVDKRAREEAKLEDVGLKTEPVENQFPNNGQGNADQGNGSAQEEEMDNESDQDN